ncbi:MAG: hypothetical protein JST65_14485 [Acidobacteria bacterium]|nr:hypothetical protein [Acidobacteriota bacterium]
MLLPLFLVVASTGFEKNLGQTDSQVRYLLRSRDVSVFLTDRETVFRTSSGSSIHMESVGKPVADSVAVSTITSYVGPRERWREEVPVFDRIVRRGVFPGIALVHYGAEYDYVVAPGANPRAIAVRFTGQKKSLRIDEAGSLVFDGDLRHRRPVAYQRDLDGNKTPVDAWFQLRGNTVTFGLGEYDSSRELVIDPEFEAVRFYGGSGDDELLDAGMVAGTTTSIDYPFAYSPPRGGRDVFIWTSGRVFYFGGSGDERPTALFPVFGGYVLAGETTSRDLPLASTSSFRTSSATSPPSVRGAYAGGETDGFLLSVYYGIVRPATSTISASYVGGSGRDRVVAVTDSMVIVNTDSPDLLTTDSGPFSKEPATNYICTIVEPFVAGYLNGAAITTAIENAGVVVAGSADGSLRTIRTDGAADRRSALPGGLPVRSIRVSSAGWGLVAVSDRAVARFDPETLAVQALYGIRKSTRVRDLLLKQNYALIAGRYDGEDTPDGFLTAVDLSTGSVPLWMPAGGDGIDEASSMIEYGDGTIHVVGTSTSSWGGAVWRGGTDAFEATVRIPFADLAVFVPQQVATGYDYPLPLPDGVTAVSSDPSRIRVAGSGKNTVLEAYAATGAATVTIHTGGDRWPAAFRVGVFTPRASFEVPFGGKLVVDGSGLVYAGYDAFGNIRPGVAPPKFRVRVANPALASVTPSDLDFTISNRAPITITATPGAQGNTELILESNAGVRVASLLVEVVRPLPTLPGPDPCVTARGFSLINRAPIPFLLGEPAVLRSANPGELRFARDLEAPDLVAEITVPAYSQIRIAASVDAAERQAVEYATPGGQGALVWCTAITPQSALMDNVAILQLRDGPRQTRLGASYFDRRPLPIAYRQGARIVSSDPSVVSVEVGPDWTVTLTPNALGRATLSIAVPGATPVDVPVAVVDGALLNNGGPVSVGKDLQTPVSFGRGDALPGPVTLESSDPSRAVLSLDPATPGSAKIALPNAGTQFWVQGLGDSGEVSIRISGGGYSPSQLAVQLYPSVVGVSPPQYLTELRAGLELSVQLTYLALFETVRFFPGGPSILPAVEQRLRPSIGPARVRVSVDNPAVLTVDQANLVAPASMRIRTLRPGDARLRLSVEGFGSLDRLNEIPIRVVPAP